MFDNSVVKHYYVRLIFITVCRRKMDKRFEIINQFYTNFFIAKTNLMKTSQKLFEPTGINFASWQIVIHISVFGVNNKGMMTSELAEDLQISRQAVQKQLKCLLNEELVVATENKIDKRSPYYCLTDKGAELCRSVIENIYKDWMLQSMEGYSSEEIQAATNILVSLTKFKHCID